MKSPILNPAQQEVMDHDLIIREAAQLREHGGHSLGFVQSRRRSKVLTKHLCFQGIQSGYHHGLQYSDRRSIKEAFRKKGPRY
ncbi:MAG: hypothetical protein WCH98_14720 [Verrucomicrobiota bacterium]